MTETIEQRLRDLQNNGIFVLGMLLAENGLVDIKIITLAEGLKRSGTQCTYIDEILKKQTPIGMN